MSRGDRGAEQRAQAVLASCHWLRRGGSHCCCPDEAGNAQKGENTEFGIVDKEAKPSEEEARSTVTKEVTAAAS